MEEAEHQEHRVLSQVKLNNFTNAVEATFYWKENEEKLDMKNVKMVCSSLVHVYECKSSEKWDDNFDDH